MWAEESRFSLCASFSTCIASELYLPSPRHTALVGALPGFLSCSHMGLCICMPSCGWGSWFLHLKCLSTCHNVPQIYRIQNGYWYLLRRSDVWELKKFFFSPTKLDQIYVLCSIKYLLMVTYPVHNAEFKTKRWLYKTVLKKAFQACLGEAAYTSRKYSCIPVSRKNLP